jgi:hypothetical protein
MNSVDNIHAAQSLRRKYLNARHSVNSSTAAFNDLNSTVSEEHRNIWLAEEATAQRMRVKNPSAMDTYQLRLQRGGSADLSKVGRCTYDPPKHPQFRPLNFGFSRMRQVPIEVPLHGLPEV